ncbi:carboxypeptidase-like regulatory domain-containing protein [Rhodothermus marinus]|uniref:TonB-dependent receptor n=1 Tax=Rhodothermus marinus TaxID=29549 RepID=UPI0037C93C24
MKRALRILGTLLLVGLWTTGAWAQTGKITGRVVDANTGEPLPGVNVVIDGTTMGATTDIDGYYTIINVRPGTYTLRASFVGYVPQVVENVQVDVGLTTEVNFALQETAIGLQEVVVQATRPIVQPDISASIVNIDAAVIEALPVATDVAQVIGLQPGFEPGLVVRGFGGNQVAFLLDGMNLADPRTNAPFTGVSFTAVEEVQAQTGGFTAEYGNVRSGLINVVMKEPRTNRYTVDAILRYAPAQPKTFNGDANDRDFFWMRPYFDPEVAMIGTEAAWDDWTERQYPKFEGWEEAANDYPANNDSDPSNDVTAAQLQKAYEWMTRKNTGIDDPEYQIDATITGPVPAIGASLGNLRFLVSHRRTQSAYIIPQRRRTYRDYTTQAKLVSDIAAGAKLELVGLWSKRKGLVRPIAIDQGATSTMLSGDPPAYPWDWRYDLENRILGDDGVEGHVARAALYGDWVINPMDIDYALYGAKFTHALTPNTFYEVQLQRVQTDYLTGHIPPRNPDPVVCVTPEPAILPIDDPACQAPNVIRLNEAPFGYESKGAQDGLSANGLRIGGHGGAAFDTSSVSRWVINASLTSQVNRYLQIKGGFEFHLSDYQMNYGEYDPFFVHHANPTYRWHRKPQQGAAFLQSKLEFKGLIANLGVRLDYFNPSGKWYVYEPYDRAFTAVFGVDKLDEVLSKEPVDKQLTLSPRLGISFPVSANSKLYFNYGHFRQMPDPVPLFEIERINTGAVARIGNPNLPLQKTVAYELGFEQNLFDMFLLRLAGYYRDVSNQVRFINFQSIDGEVNYWVARPWNYGDVRGFELSLAKDRGRWIQGFINYTYMAWKGGNFGFEYNYENLVAQQNYLLTSTDHYQSKPVPEPYARVNIDLVTPEDYGPNYNGMRPLAGWRLSLLGTWRAGQVLTWTGQQLVAGGSPIRGIEQNVQWKDYYNLDLRLSKTFNMKFGEVQFFMDVSNVLNLRYMDRMSGFTGADDLLDYMKSLHLPANTFEGLENPPYQFIPGNDQPGDYRKPGVEFVPIEVCPPAGCQPVGDEPTRPLYYQDGTYYSYTGSEFVEADPDFVKKVLDNKAYIDMPNADYLTFFNPRRVYFGLRISF